MLLGRYWPYMTPQHIYEEMTIEEVQMAVEHILRWEMNPRSKEHYEHMIKGIEEWLCLNEISAQDLSWIKSPIGRVIKKHGH